MFQDDIVEKIITRKGRTQGMGQRAGESETGHLDKGVGGGNSEKLTYEPQSK